MTIRSIADARAIMFMIHAERRHRTPGDTVQTFDRPLEDMIATDKFVVADELQRIQRATECNEAFDLDAHVRKLLESE